MDSWLYNPELEMMRWRLQVLAMGLQHQSAGAATAGHQLSYVPFHLQQSSGFQSSPGFQTSAFQTADFSIKQEPLDSGSQSDLPSSLVYRPAFQSRCGSVSPRLESRGSSSSPSSYRSSPSPTSPPTWSGGEQSEPLDLSMATKVMDMPTQVKQENRDVESLMMPPQQLANSVQVCNVCNKEYNSPAALNMHMRTHTAGCKCPFCGKSFSRPWLLQGHIRTHTGEKPYACSQCNKSFADKSNLRAHVQTHSDVKPFGCSRCGKKFALKSYLSKHEESSCLRLVTGGKYS